MANTTPFARETLTVSNAVKVLTPTVYVGTISGGNQNGNRANRAKRAVIRVDTAGLGIRVTRDGTTPVAATTGEVFVNSGTLPIPAGSVLDCEVNGYGAICGFKMIREGASDAVVQVEYYV